jgi:hypothetical protein
MQQDIVKDGNSKQTTKVWWFLVECNDGSSEWVSVKDLKDGNPVELSDIVIAHDIADELAFSWWIHHVQKKRDKKDCQEVEGKVLAVNTQVWCEDAKSVNDTLQMDQENGNAMWERAIKKEMGKAKVAYEPNKGGSLTAQEIQEKKLDTMIFDVKMDFSRKA